VVERFRYLMTLMSQLNAVADRLVHLLFRVADGQTLLSMHKYFCHATMDVIAEACRICHSICSCMYRVSERYHFGSAALAFYAVFLVFLCGRPNRPQ